MKKITPSGYIIVMIVVFSGLFCNSVFSQKDLNPKIASAIKSANARDLSLHFNNPIDLTTPGNEGTYSKAQAEMIVKSFFQKYPPTSFTLNHQGKSNDGSQYAIGTYKSGVTEFRTYLLLKLISGQPLIHQLKFESDED
ncbi:MAG: DUF4783 domain-containing protein [Bacteroidales bacterium]|nr:DUF4783 domain-containing protein [Bacteroidales bacterium]